ncbi:MAG: glycosyltransferase [Tannerella sp.]|jgi:serine/threonine protein kinase|nr:glycosyltransferase [Tannerella sp.]
MKITINPEYKQFTEFVESVPTRFDKEGKVIYKIRNEIRVLNAGKESINVKRFRIPQFFNRIIYTFFRPSKAKRSFFNAIRLMNRGIETPEPIAYIITKRGGLINYSYYITKQSDFRHTMYEFGKGGIAGRENILKTFVLFTVKLHEAGIYHCDYSPGNILFDEINGEVKFSLVDLNRMKFGKISLEKGCESFARLWGQKPMFELIANIYAQTCKADIQYCMEKILSARSRFWKRFGNKHPVPFASDETAADTETLRLSVILFSHNQPDRLEKVLWGYEAQTDKRFEVIIANDASEDNTFKRIENLRSQISYSVKHVWLRDEGYHKYKILNKAIMAAAAPYLLFSNGDCIPRMDFVAEHLKFATVNSFLAGGSFKLPLNISNELTKEDILSGRCFNIKWLKSKGLKPSFKNSKLTSFGLKEKLANSLTRAKTSWNGDNSSAWYSDIIAFNEGMQYGKGDREFGKRLENNGIRGKQICYSAVCLHMEHSREHGNKESCKKTANPEF